MSKHPGHESLLELAEDRAAEAASKATSAASAAFRSVTLGEKGDSARAQEAAELAGRLFGMARRACDQSASAAFELVAACNRARAEWGDQAEMSPLETAKEAAHAAAMDAGHALVSASHAVALVASLPGDVSMPEILATIHGIIDGA